MTGLLYVSIASEAACQLVCPRIFCGADEISETLPTVPAAKEPVATVEPHVAVEEELFRQ